MVRIVEKIHRNVPVLVTDKKIHTILYQKTQMFQNTRLMYDDNETKFHKSVQAKPLRYMTSTPTPKYIPEYRVNPFPNPTRLNEVDRVYTQSIGCAPLRQPV